MTKYRNFVLLEDRLQYNILYSCTGEAKRGHDPFVKDHALMYVTSGEVHFFTANGELIFKEGTLGLVRRNQLIKAIKKPGVDKPFMSINILFNLETLKTYCLQNNVQATGIYLGEHILQLPVDIFMKGYFDSLVPYFEHPEQLNETLAGLKTTEAIELLLRNPLLKNLLFDFGDPYKIDLETYMNRHFVYHVPLEEFAKLTGRSLSTFKRDFMEIFGTTPGRWLQQKRLEHAYYLITQRNQRPSEIYLDAGFENLAHFSTAYKKKFGFSPSGSEAKKR